MSDALSLRQTVSAVGLRESSSSAKPAASLASRGLIWVEKGGTGVADRVFVCVKTSADTFTWLQVGGVGSGSVFISGSEELDFPSIPSGETADLSFTATGAVAGQPLAVGAPPGLEAGLYVASAWISADDEITIRLGNNLSTGEPVDPALRAYTWVTGFV